MPKLTRALTLLDVTIPTAAAFQPLQQSIGRLAKSKS